MGFFVSGMKMREFPEGEGIRMREYLYAGLLAAIIVAAGCGGDAVKYVSYPGKQAPLDISMDYPQGWVYTERRDAEAGYGDVIFVENRKGKAFQATMMATVQKASLVKEGAPSSGSLLDSLVSRRLRFKEARIIKRSVTRVAGLYASQALVAYKTVERPADLEVSSIAVKERIIVMRRGDWFYILRYENEEKEFAAYDKAFAHVLKTLQFRRSVP